MPGYPSQFPGSVRKHILVTEQQEVRRIASCVKPARNIFAPCTPIFRNQIPTHEVVHGSIQSIVIWNLAVLALKVVQGKCDIPRITNDVNHFPIPVIEILMRLNDPRTRGTLESAIGLRRSVWDQALDIGEADDLSRVRQIGDQKAGPGISR